VTLISRADLTVPVTTQGRTVLEPATAFKIVMPIDLPSVLPRWGFFPGVRGVRDQTAAWDRVGTTRRLDLTDGSSAVEKLTEYDPGRSFAYEVTNITSVLGRLVFGVRGEWTFTTDGPGTVIRWTYEFKPRPGMLVPVRFGLAAPWRAYMNAGLGRVIAAAESAVKG
jgi:Polyketide cyclase / dehydrase and lipid transport